MRLIEVRVLVNTSASKPAALSKPDSARPAACDFSLFNVSWRLHNELHPLSFINGVVRLRMGAAGRLLTTSQSHFGVEGLLSERNVVNQVSLIS